MASTTAGRSVGIRLRTHAKLNLFLRVVGRRPDGYHEIESIFHGISLADGLEVRRTDDTDVVVEMNLAEDANYEAPKLEENLAYLAARALIERGVTGSGVRMDIDKRIPIGAGLGGGSGNAAGVLVALNDLWEAGLDDAGLHSVGGVLGSDVPYCLVGGTMLATARGENLSSLPSPHDLHLVLGISDVPLLTKEVYAKWDEVGGVGESGSAPMVLALGSGDTADVGQLLHNDLEPAAFALRPELEELKKVILGAGALGASMTGSGPTLFGLAADADHAKQIAANIQDRFDRVEVVQSSQRCVEVLD